MALHAPAMTPIAARMAHQSKRASVLESSCSLLRVLASSVGIYERMGKHKYTHIFMDMEVYHSVHCQIDSEQLPRSRDCGVAKALDSWIVQ